MLAPFLVFSWEINKINNKQVKQEEGKKGAISMAAN